MKSFSKIAIMLALAMGLFATPASAFDTVKPSQYFNDYAHVLSPERDKQLNDQLADYERKTTNQFVAVVFPDKTLDQPIEQIGIDLARQWQIGQKGGENQLGTANRNNGILFLVFPAAHKMRVEVGRGLEGSLPDSAVNNVLRNVVAPQFKSNNFDAGITQGIAALQTQASAEGNKGVNRTVEEQKRDREATNHTNYIVEKNHVIHNDSQSSGGFGWVFIIILMGIAAFILSKLFGSKNSSSSDDSDSSGQTINNRFDSYHGGYTPQPPAPAPYVPPVRSTPSWTRNYSAPTPAPQSHSNVGAALVGGAVAGIVADELIRPRSETKKKSSSDDSSDYSGSSSSWTPSVDTSSSSSSSSDSSSSSSSSSYDSGSSSSWSDSSSSSDFSSGGGDFGGGGSSSDW